MRRRTRAIWSVLWSWVSAADSWWMMISLKQLLKQMSHHDPSPLRQEVGLGSGSSHLMSKVVTIYYFLIRLLLLNSPVSSITGSHNAAMALGVKGQPNKVAQNSTWLRPPHSIHILADTRRCTLAAAPLVWDKQVIFTRAAAPQDQLQSSSSSRRPECISEGGGASARASVTAELPNMQITDNQPIHPKVRPFSICDPSVERLLRRHYRVTSDWLASCVMGGAELTVVCNKVSTLMNLTSDLQQKTVV